MLESVLTHSHLLVLVSAITKCAVTVPEDRGGPGGGSKQKQRVQCLVLQSSAQKNKDEDPSPQTDWKMKNSSLVIALLTQALLEGRRTAFFCCCSCTPQRCGGGEMFSSINLRGAADEDTDEEKEKWKVGAPIIVFRRSGAQRGNMSELCTESSLLKPRDFNLVDNRFYSCFQQKHRGSKVDIY